MEPQKQASEIALELCKKLNISYTPGKGSCTLHGVPITPDAIKHLFPSTSHTK